MTKQYLPLLILLPTLICNSHAALAQTATEDQKEQVKVLVFTEPAPAEIAAPEYPSRPLRAGHEGMVEINFMVDTNGEAFEAFVGTSVGSKDFHQAALNALKRSRFEPATLNGEPIIGASTYVYRFNLESFGMRETSSFSRKYSEYSKDFNAGKSGDVATILAELEALGAQNSSENAYLNLLRFQQAAVSGTPLEQMEYLHAALSNSTRAQEPVYFDQQTVRQLRKALFNLQVKNMYYVQALNTFELLAADGDDETVAQFAETASAIRALRVSGEEFGIPMQLSEKNKYFWLLRNKLYLTDGKGQLDELRFYCEGRYYSLKPEWDFSYELPEAWGSCKLRFVGAPGTSFTLVQH